MRIIIVFSALLICYSIAKTEMPGIIIIVIGMVVAGIYDVLEILKKK